MTKEIGYTRGPDLTDAEIRDAEYVKTLISKVGLVAGLFGFSVFIAARLLLH